MTGQFEKQRAAMIRRLRDLGIDNEVVLQAMNTVPRHLFVARGLEFQAYDEKALPIGFGQTVSHPYTVAYMTQMLEIKTGNKVLEVGTGSGYQTAVLCALGAQVYSIELVKNLAEDALKTLRKLGHNCALRTGDGSRGWAAYAPYDRILVTAGAPVLPDVLIEQLSDEGKLLIPVGNREEQVMHMFQKKDDEVEAFRLEKFNFVPMRGKEGWKTEQD